MSISNYAEDKMLDPIRNTSFTVAATYIKLHVGDPGEDGTANAATETTRKAVTWSAPSGGTMTSAATVEWTNVSTTEDYTHWSLWDADTAGNCLWTGALSSTASVTAGGTFQITSLSLTLS